MEYDFLFEDGSLFSVPPGWREVSGRRFGAVHPVEFEARLRFVIGEYRANRAMPSKFDEIGCEKETRSTPTEQPDAIGRAGCSTPVPFRPTVDSWRVANYSAGAAR
jgi:hypothetical protein